MAIFNSTAPCPYCYTEINPRKLAHCCSGRSQHDRTPCAKAPDSTRQRHFGDSDPYWPVIAPVGSSSCRDCGAALGPAICPACHSSLPLEFSAAHLQIGVMGEYNSGKSTYLAALDSEIQQSGSDFLQGEPLEGNGAFAYLASSTAILLVLDPFNFQTNAGSRAVRGLREPCHHGACERIVQNAAIAVRQARGIKLTKAVPVPLACFVAKMDAFSDVGDREAATYDVQRVPYSSSQVRARLDAWGAANLIHVVETEFATVRYFGGSALGSEPDYADAPQSGQPPRPYGVAAPLLWFMANKGLVRSKHLDQNLKESA